MKVALIVGVGMIAGNFAYQLCGEQNWMLAAERSWFQFSACLCVGLANLLLCRSVGGL